MIVEDKGAGRDNGGQRELEKLGEIEMERLRTAEKESDKDRKMEARGKKNRDEADRERMKVR